METFHRGLLTGHTPGMFLEAKNRRKMAHFIAVCGRAFNCLTEMMQRTVGTTVCVRFRAI